MTAALKAGDLGSIAHRMYNVFESVPDKRYEEIAAIRRTMLDCGALGAIMTGSGSAVFGVFSDPIKAMRARDFLRKQQKFCVSAKNIQTLSV